MLALHLRGARPASLAILALVTTSWLVVPRSARAGDRAEATASPQKATLERLDAGKSPTFAVQPKPGSERRPMAIYLHGIHGRPENGCPWFDNDAFGWLVCPAATRMHDNGTFSWAWSNADGVVVAHAEALARERGATGGPPVLVGFSEGAFVAARIATERAGRSRALVLVGADVRLDASALTRAGITRVALLAGDYDGASAPMRRTANALATAGVAARFVSLGRAGHSYVPENAAHAAAVGAALAWAAEASRPES